MNNEKLKEARYCKNFALCLHLETNSERLFSSGLNFACIICSFSAKQRPQAFAPERNEVACFTTFHVLLLRRFQTFRFQTCFESFVLADLFRCLNEEVWLLNLALKVVEQDPKYTFDCFPEVMVAW